MKKSVAIAVLSASTLALAACGGSGDASSDLEVETVEQPAEAALEPVTEEPVEDTEASVSSEEVAGPAPVSEQTATEAAEAAEGVAAAVEAAEAAAAAEAAEVAAAAEAAAELDIE